MAKSASEISRLNAKSTFSKADSDITTSSSVLGKPEREFPYPAPLVEHGDARIISVVNQKGGVGKTTTTINLGAAFAELGRRVLLVDFDPQHSLSVGLNVSFALRGVALLDDIIKKVQINTNPELKLLGILPTMFDRKTVHSREVLERISEAFPEKVFDTTIARTVRFPETTVAGEPITSYASSSVGAASYRRLAREIIANGGVR